MSVPVLMPQMLTTETRMENPALVGFVGSIVKRGSVKATVGGGQTLATRPDSRNTKVKVPVLIIVGKEDPIYPVEMQQKIHQDTPGSRLVIIPGAAHAVIIEKPAQCTAAILNWASGIK